jgi:hypothetical protein
LLTLLLLLDRVLQFQAAAALPLLLRTLMLMRLMQPCVCQAAAATAAACGALPRKLLLAAALCRVLTAAGSRVIKLLLLLSTLQLTIWPRMTQLVTWLAGLPA